MERNENSSTTRVVAQNRTLQDNPWWHYKLPTHSDLDYIVLKAKIFQVKQTPLETMKQCSFHVFFAHTQAKTSDPVNVARGIKKHLS